jgi:bifunctional non-homologous end joining protein LigD
MACAASHLERVAGFALLSRNRGSRVGLGALLVGYYDRGQLRYAGKVGTGYDTKTLRRLGRLSRPKQPGSAFVDQARIQEGDVTWVKPLLVAEIAFIEWTRDGKLRHPRYLAIRQAGTGGDS